MTADREQVAIATTLASLAIASLVLSRRSPSWRPLTASLAALAAIDVLRLWTAPLGQTRAHPWWEIDVALCAMWPAAIGLGLRVPGGRQPIGPRLALLGLFSVFLGAVRPMLTRLVYFSALRMPRWGLVSLWVETGVCAAWEAQRNDRPDRVSRAALLCSLVLAGTHAADLVVGAWMVAPWEVPDWEYARPVTWTAYGVVGVVLLAAIVCRR